MEHNLDSIVMGVKQLHSPNLVQNRISGIIRHVVRRNRRQRVPLQRKDTTLQKNLVLLRQEVLNRGELFSVLPVNPEQG